MAHTYVVAELGTAHNGDLKRAAALVAAAAESGADCAKFQYVIADEIIHPATGNVDLPGGSVALYDRFRSLERKPDFYMELRALCDRHDVDFLCTPFGTGSMDALVKMGVDRLKIASPELNHTQLLEAAKKSGLPTIVSTGVSLLADIEYAVRMLSSAEVTLLHCVSAYPAPEADYNLRVIPSLSRVFGLPVGLSDHSESPTLVPGLAVALGACIVEKHFTIDRAGDGLDDRYALDTTLFTEMAATIRRIDAVLSLDSAHGGQRVVNEFKAEFGEDRVRDALGDGVKRLAPSEEPNYATTRRSIHAVRDLSAGAAVSAGDVAVLRTEKNLSPGLEPRHLQHVIGARLSRSLTAGAGVRWADLVNREQA